MSARVRLGWRWDGAVEVRLCAVKNRAVSNRNCVVATRGGEQRNENDQFSSAPLNMAFYKGFDTHKHQLTRADVCGIVCIPMASIHKREQSRYYTAAFYGPDGRRMQVSTKQTDKRLAQAAAAEFERASRLARHGELAEAQARKIVNDLMARAGGGEQLRTVTTEGHFKSWMAGKETNRSAGTARRYAPVVDGFLASLGTRATKPLAALAPGDVERYVTELGQRGLSGRTVGLHVAAIRTALNSARRQGVIPTNVAEAVERPAVLERTKGTFTDPEVAMLVSAAEGEWRTLVLVGNFSGLRLGDCAKLEWRGVDLTAGTITTTMQKTGKPITIPMHPSLLAHFETLAGTDAPEPFVMPTLAHKHHGGRMGLSRSFLELMRKAGVAAEDAKGNQRSFHSFRHGFTSRLANAGIAPELRMKLTGHQSAAIHQGYTHLEMETLRGAVGKLASLTP